MDGRISIVRIGVNTIFLVPGEGGGIERYLRGLITAFRNVDQDNEFVVFTNRDNTGTFDIGDNFEECLAPISARFRPAKILWEQFVLPLQASRTDVDVLLSPGNICPLFAPCPSIVVIHDLIPFTWPDNFNKVELYSLKTLLLLTGRRATKIITVSNNSRKQIMDRLNIPHSRICVVHEACDERFLSHETSAESKQTIKKRLGITGEFILCVSSTRPYKNIDRLLLAFNLLKEKSNIDHTLVITGPRGRHHGSILKMVRDLRLTQHVVLSGYIGNDDLPALYSAASVFVYPSLYEGFGLPVLESMACGTPVAAARSASLPEVLGDAGLLFDPYDPESIAAAIHQLIVDRSLRRECIAKGRKRVNLFSWDRVARSTLSVLTSANRDMT